MTTQMRIDDGVDATNLIERIVRMHIRESRYWKVRRFKIAARPELTRVARPLPGAMLWPHGGAPARQGGGAQVLWRHRKRDKQSHALPVLAFQNAASQALV